MHSFGPIRVPGDLTSLIVVTAALSCDMFTVGTAIVAIRACDARSCFAHEFSFQLMMPDDTSAPQTVYRRI